MCIQRSCTYFMPRAEIAKCLSEDRVPLCPRCCKKRAPANPAARVVLCGLAGSCDPTDVSFTQGTVSLVILASGLIM